MLVSQANAARQRIEELEIQAALGNSENTRLQTQLAILEEQLQVNISFTNNKLTISSLSFRLSCTRLLESPVIVYPLDTTEILGN